MTNIQKKSIQHVSEKLKSVDTYPTYNTIYNTLSESGVDSKIISKVMDKYQESISIENKKISECKDWLNTILSDLN